MNIESFLSHLPADSHLARNGAGWHCRCPAHEDSNPSLSITEGKDGRILLKCHAGCSFESIVGALGLQKRDLFPAKAERAASRGTGRRITATYDYTDEQGRLLFQVCRYEPKDFRQRRPDPDKPGAWLWDTKGVRRVLYRLPAIRVAVASGLPIVLCEGEKDVHALVAHGFEATTMCGGAKKDVPNWRAEYTATLAAAEAIVIIADKDGPEKDFIGQQHAAAVAAALRPEVPSLKVLELPDVDGKPTKDASDFFANGGTAEGLATLIDAAPEWEPTAPHAEDSQPEGQPAPSEPTSEEPDRLTPYQDLIDKYGPPVFISDKSVRGVNERFFAALIHSEGNVLFEPAERCFYEYSTETGLWARVSEEHMRERISSRIVDFGREIDIPLESKATIARVTAISSALRGIAERRGVFRRGTDFMHLQNGVIRFGGGGSVGMDGFRQEDYSRNRCPIPYDPDAECPRFVSTLLGPALPPEDIDLLQRWAGLALMGSNPMQRIVILDGGPATGKTTIANVIRGVVGTENCAELRTELLNTRFETFRYIGKTLLIGPDVPGDFLGRSGASALKKLVGGDAVGAEGKGLNESFSVTGNYNVLITANTRLRVRLDGDPGAWRRRLTIIRFDRPAPAVRLANLADRLLDEEGPGIVRWALAGAMRARQEIAETGDLRLTPGQAARVDALLSESNSVHCFLAECIESGEGDVSANELTEEYYHYCASRDWTPLPARQAKQTFADGMLERYGASQRHDIRREGRSVRGWRGVTLRRDAPAEEYEPERESAYA